jgi:hypothetical protein
MTNNHSLPAVNVSALRRFNAYQQEWQSAEDVGCSAAQFKALLRMSLIVVSPHNAFLGKISPQGIKYLDDLYRE